MLSRYNLANKGTGGAGQSRITNADNCLAVSTVAPAITKLWALPILLPAGRLSKIGYEVTTAGGSGNLANVGFFSNTGTAGQLYPGKFMFAGTEADGTATGLKESTITQDIDEGLYWIVFANGAGTVATVRAVAVGGLPNLLGSTSTPVPITAISVAATYNSTFTSMLTDSGGYYTFPTGGAYETAAMPLVWVTYSK